MKAKVKARAMHSQNIIKSCIFFFLKNLKDMVSELTLHLSPVDLPTLAFTNRICSCMVSVLVLLF